MNAVSWSIQGLLAAVFLIMGSKNLLRPDERLERALGTPVLRAVGLLELTAVVGLILPGALGVAPVLVGFAAVGVSLLMVGAVFVNRLVANPPAYHATNAVVLGLAAVVSGVRLGDL